MKPTVIIFAALLLLGCRSSEEVSDERLARLHTRWDEQSTRFEQQPVAVKQGTTPLAHIFITGGPIRVIDLTTKMQVAAGTLVRVDEKHGVIAGDVTLAPGPLAAGHEYAIYADPVTDNVIRHGVGPPAKQ
jgi:hypothetical protein